MIIKNARVFNTKGYFEDKDLVIDGGRFVDSSKQGTQTDYGTVIDAKGLMAIPGLVDIHFHGAVGHDFCDADSAGLKEILEYELSSGIMAACPATMTFPEEKLGCIIDSALSLGDNDKGADLVGINMEGPFINQGKVAAQNPEYVQKADSDMFFRLQDRAKGLIKLVDIAPEADGNMSFIDEVKGKVSVSLAHTLADYDTAKEAFNRGASQLTHMFNAMNDIGHRAPGPALAAQEAGAFVELICDGVHNHDAIIRMVFNLFDKNKIVLISDSMMATGLADGTYELGGQKVDVNGNECRLSEHKDVIAGSNTNLYECLKHAVLVAKVPIEKAIKAATINPARAIQIDEHYGSFAEGCYGNVLLIDDDFNVVVRIHKGERV